MSSRSSSPAVPSARFGEMVARSVSQISSTSQCMASASEKATSLSNSENDETSQVFVRWRNAGRFMTAATISSSVPLFTARAKSKATSGASEPCCACDV